MGEREKGGGKGGKGGKEKKKKGKVRQNKEKVWGGGEIRVEKERGGESLPDGNFRNAICHHSLKMMFSFNLMVENTL